MGKNTDIIKVLLVILLGMFIPFLGAIALTYGFDIKQIAITFGYFILIFGVELFIVYIYFTVGNKVASKKMEKYKPK
jgi:hypothetical protein